MPKKKATNVESIDKNRPPRRTAVRPDLRLVRKVEPVDKVHENLLRRMADRQGYTFTKSRRRDPRALDYGTYTLIDVAGNEFAGLSIDAVEAILTGDDQ